MCRLYFHHSYLSLSNQIHLDVYEISPRGFLLGCLGHAIHVFSCYVCVPNITGQVPFLSHPHANLTKSWNRQVIGLTPEGITEIASLKKRNSHKKGVAGQVRWAVGPNRNRMVDWIRAGTEYVLYQNWSEPEPKLTSELIPKRNRTVLCRSMQT